MCFQDFGSKDLGPWFPSLEFSRNNLVILGIYIPHDLVHGATRINIWETLSREINGLRTNRNVIALGDFNASLHARKADEEQHIGNNILGKDYNSFVEKQQQATSV